MEMCIDNPREGFADIFDTHPSVDARVAALVKFAGGHDPGPLALAAPEEREQLPDETPRAAGASAGPWGGDRRNSRRPPQAPGVRSRLRPVRLGRGGRNRSDASTEGFIECLGLSLSSLKAPTSGFNRSHTPIAWD